MFLPLIHKSYPPPPTPTATLTPTNTPISTVVPTTVPPSPTLPPRLPGIINGGFESGRSVWIETSSQGWPLIVSQAQVEPDARTGNWFAWLGGDYDELSGLTQGFIVPPDRPRVSYWRDIISTDVCGYDIAGVALYEDGSTEPIVLDAFWLCSPNDTGGYRSSTLDLSAWSGKYVTLVFVTENDNTLLSSLLLDDFSHYTVRNVGNEQDRMGERYMEHPRAQPKESSSLRPRTTTVSDAWLGTLLRQLREEVQSRELR